MTETWERRRDEPPLPLPTELGRLAARWEWQKQALIVRNYQRNFLTYSPLRAPARVFAGHLGSIFLIIAAGTATVAGPGTPHPGADALDDLEFGRQFASLNLPQNSEWTYGAQAVDVGDGRRAGQNGGSEIPVSIEGNAVLELAATYVGTPYVWGGKTPHGFDCSGFVSYVYAQFGVKLPTSTRGYSNYGTRVSRADAQPGDLVYIPGHIGIYAGGDLVIEAPNSASYVQFRTMWQDNPVFIRVA